MSARQPSTGTARVVDEAVLNTCRYENRLFAALIAAYQAKAQDEDVPAAVISFLGNVNSLIERNDNATIAYDLRWYGEVLSDAAERLLT